MAATQVFVDANVLRSRTLRDWLFLLRDETVGGMFTVCSTEDVIAEVVYTIRREKPRAPGYLTRAVHDRITDSLDYRVDDFPENVPGYPGTDPHDEHVHAAASASGAGIVLTADKGFTSLHQAQLDALPYEVYHPDDFFMLADESAPRATLAVARTQLEYWCSKKPAGGINLVAALERAQCPIFAERLQQRLQGL